MEVQPTDKLSQFDKVHKVVFFQNDCLLKIGRAQMRQSRLANTRSRIAQVSLVVVLLASNPAFGGDTMTFSLSSSVFVHEGEIPSKYSCDGDDLSPPLSWSGVTDGARSLALILDDPDAPDPAAPKMTWVHWVLYNLPVDSAGLPEAVAASELPSGALEGKNDWKRTGYGGPCPPIGRHRYFFKLYALDIVLPDLRRPTKADLEQAMQGHVLADAVLMGTYSRSR